MKFQEPLKSHGCETPMIFVDFCKENSGCPVVQTLFVPEVKIKR